MIKNAFTGEPMTKEKVKTQKEIDDGLKTTFAMTGGDQLRTRPKSRGVTYGDDKPSLTDQTARDSCDINNIMRRYEKTGQLTELIAAGLRGETGMFYGDFTDAPTFQESLNIVIHAQDQFMRLDARVRNRFDNDPAKFFEFVHDEKNREEATRMGLLAKPKDPEVTLRDLDKTLKDGFSGASKASPKGKQTPPLGEGHDA